MLDLHWPSINRKLYTLSYDIRQLGVKEIFEPARAVFTMTDETGIYAKHIEQLITLNIQTASGTNAADAHRNRKLENNVIYVAQHIMHVYGWCIYASTHNN